MLDTEATDPPRDPGISGRVMFASVPSAGLINPLLAIAAELNERGIDDLWFASMDERRRDIESIPGKGKVHFVSLGSYKPELDSAQWSDEILGSMTTGRRLRDIAVFLGVNTDHDYTAQQYHRTLREFKRIRPAFAVIDLCTPWAIDAAMTAGVPFALSAPVPASGMYMERLPWSYPTPFSGLPRDMTVSQRVANAAFRLGIMALLFHPRRLPGMIAAMRQRKAEGLANPSGLPSKYADAAVCVLAYSVFGMEYLFPAPPNLEMVGTAIRPDPPGTTDDDDITRWLDQHDSVIYIGFGTIMRPTRQQVEALTEVCRRLGPRHHVLWKLPPAQQQLLPHDLPPNLRVESWLPSQLAVLAHPHVRAFFNHAGINAIHEGLYYGKPQLVMPFWMDCYDSAARAVDSGAALGVQHRDNLDIADITAKLTTLVSNPDYAQRARTWADTLRQAGGISTAADLIIKARQHVQDVRPGRTSDPVG
jgi:polyene glycosyltransferase